MKTKNWYLLTLILSLGLRTAAQETLHFSGGEEVKAKVLDRKGSLVVFSKENDPDAKSFYCETSDLAYIRYADGRIEQFNAIRDPELIAASSPDEPVSYAGFRVGYTVFGPGNESRSLENQARRPSSFQLGWQFEKRYYSGPGGFQALVEFVPMVGGIDQGLFIPSATALLGFRFPMGFELGMGPVISTSGPSMVFAAGASLRLQRTIIPINLAFVPEVKTNTMDKGYRLSLLVGFNRKVNKK